MPLTSARTRRLGTGSWDGSQDWSTGRKHIFDGTPFEISVYVEIVAKSHTGRILLDLHRRQDDTVICILVSSTYAEGLRGEAEGFYGYGLEGSIFGGSIDVYIEGGIDEFVVVSV